MKRNLATSAFAAALLFAIAFAVAAPAFANPFLSFGVLNKNETLANFLYGEFSIASGIALGTQVSTDNTVTLSLWQGHTKGWYAEYEFTLGDAHKPSIGLGAWETRLVARPNLALTGWLGAHGDVAGSRLWMEANGELGLALTPSFSLFAGANATFFKKNNTASTWLSVGYAF